jgi:hypothetical protein
LAVDRFAAVAVLARVPVARELAGLARAAPAFDPVEALLLRPVEPLVFDRPLALDEALPPLA